MAYDTLVDGAKLEENLTKVADAIRSNQSRLLKKNEKLSFPYGFIYEIGQTPGEIEMNPSLVSKLATILANNKTKTINLKLRWVDVDGSIFAGDLHSAQDGGDSAIVIAQNGYTFSGNINDSCAEYVYETEGGDMSAAWDSFQFGTEEWWGIDPNYQITDVDEWVLLLEVLSE